MIRKEGSNYLRNVLRVLWHKILKILNGLSLMMGVLLNFKYLMTRGLGLLRSKISIGLYPLKQDLGNQKERLFVFWIPMTDMSPIIYPLSTKHSKKTRNTVLSILATKTYLLTGQVGSEMSSGQR